MRHAWSIRAQLSIAGALIVCVVVACAGLAIAVQINKRDRAQIDAALLDRSARAEADFAAAGHGEGHRRPPIPARGDPDEDSLRAGGTFTRLIDRGQITAQNGDVPDESVPLPTADGFTTLHAGGHKWRSYVWGAGRRGEVRLQVLQDLEPFERRETRNNILILAITAVATLCGAVAGWVAAGILLRPLQRVRAAAVAVRDDRDTAHRLPEVRSPREVADLTQTLNEMLDRLQKSTATARRFTADAGHELRTPLTSLGAYIETLNRPSEPAPEVRKRIAADMQIEHQRLVDLLNGLQNLARGDAGALPTFSDIDIRQLVDDATNAARRRHPGVTITTSSDESYPLVEAWAEGVRLAIDNLLDNAALHGRAGGAVTVSVHSTGRWVEVTVGDDGPGIPADQRATLTTRFARGAGVTAKGSGLGLALVLQQAEIHHGAFELGDSAAGGVSATLRLPVLDDLDVT